MSKPPNRKWIGNEAWVLILGEVLQKDTFGRPNKVKIHWNSDQKIKLSEGMEFITMYTPEVNSRNERQN